MFSTPQHIVQPPHALLPVGVREPIDFEHESLVVQHEGAELRLELRELRRLRLELKRELCVEPVIVVRARHEL